ncbi:hypothetical protein EIB71_02455 [Kaistella daneshvariae]|uniref:Uncharacterized protein n=1 Tax=Kaistella daneshvariae TaxID=2487074 RepID=A0ABN5SXR4_9FLAO|nr:hypothetical protein [Kaistella daneshvariae]AZI66610.1 hypothetical protein EIB71_02455 [Kaistella daneshvariae]
MKTIQFLRTHFLLAAALVIAGITMSFTMTKSENSPTVYHYTSSSMAPGAFSTVGNWTVGDSNDGCLSSRDVRPCKIIVPEGSTLSSVLAGKNNSEVLDISEGYLPEP